MGARFSARPFGEDAGDICFHGQVIGNLSCVCEEGWIYDFSMFHDPICTMPTVVYQVNLIVGLFLGVPMLVGIAYHFPAVKSQATRQSALWGAALIWWILALDASMFAQQGVFEAASICFYFVFASTLGFIGTTASLLIDQNLSNFSVHFGHTLANLKSRAALLLKGFAFFSFGIFVAMAVLSRQDTYVYNIAAFAYVFCIIASVTVGALVIVSVGWQLESRIHALQPAAGHALSTEQSEALIILAKRLRKLRIMVFQAAVQNFVLFFGIVVVHLIIGATPFAYVFFVLSQPNFSIVWAGMVCLIIIVRRASSSSGTFSSSAAAAAAAAVAQPTPIASGAGLEHSIVPHSN